ncbi:MAG: hypothetical protein CO042_02390 [Parcubacteria group bacterium CG_4_9_14_0_2_um_filter_41_8]|nr:MAG: hypothetical protein AUJ34_01660 [Parcubacteria group bacterium CG1_02_41_12]PIP66814.1 MAG: hypothetical protein COW93_03620 [Parcubacteria group bacterium CG22_combo_CG10-13_8_21_14_all_41_9]PIQ80099.1 MAG: hypothetical protein COV79_02280 [Parcubacteria group bacterium CG11_big_fil_rev_8_21_14_0_20_41_14]PIR57340.1 MAG: hypothetical protein COU72_01515 [Parcubacteria group bacterium CG10_big_fil_rev_8_21_14_0_10_41_35]PIZ81072.1 MAG: hypothetical protein COY02_03165 [Parcubacteria gr
MYNLQQTFQLTGFGIFDFSWVLNDKRDDSEDAQARARAKFYFELLEIYDYPPSRVEFDVIAPGRKIADIVVYSDSAHTKPFLVAQCREDWIRDEVFVVECSELMDMARAMQAAYCVCIAGSRRRIVRLADEEDLRVLPAWQG